MSEGSSSKKGHNNTPERRSGASRKRQRTSWSANWDSLPSFLDASTSVTASLYGARRLPELRRLYKASSNQSSNPSSALRPEIPLKSGGCKTSSRHLRRRTTSNKTRKHMHASQSSGNQTSNQEKTTRKAKRARQSTLCAEHHEWQNKNLAVSLRTEKSIAESDCPKPGQKDSPPHWTMTHLWHAKRFHMENLWGWRIPLAHTNRGARAMFRVERESRCTVQDVTWERQSLTVSSVKSLPVLIQTVSRICPNLLGDSSFSNKAILCGSQMGHGAMFQVDQFPSKAIGPAWWRIVTVPQGKQTPTKCQWIIQFFFHPSLRSRLKESLQMLISNADDKTILDWDDGPYCTPACCFRVSGSVTTQVLREALGLEDVPGLMPYEWNWQAVLDTANENSSESTPIVPHGSIFKVQLNLDKKKEKKAETTNTDGIVQRGLNTTNDAINEWDPDGDASQQTDDVPDESVHQALVVRQSPRSLDCLANRAVAGWDLYVSPKVAHDVWMALALHGPCCAIGIVEQSHLDLECSPPIPVFPRDYVDTEQSQLYWDGTHPEWKVVRRLYEGGWGRLPVRKEIKVPSVLWNKYVERSDSETTTNKTTGGDEEAAKEVEEAKTKATSSVVMVRGAFGQPFLNALAACGHLPPKKTEKVGGGRRNRRPARPLNQVTNALPLSKDETTTLIETCRSLRTSLSLPAVLLGQILMLKEGRLVPGDIIQCSTITLGQVTTGSFSLTRGVCHGIVVIGAGRFLEALERVGSKSGRAVRLPDGHCKVQLLVHVRKKHAAVEATLSLII